MIKKIEDLKSVLEYLEYYYKLKETERTGWKIKLRKKNPESVASHTFLMIVIALLFSELNNYSIKKIIKIIKLIMIHDLGESIIGDYMPESIDKKRKAILENDATVKIITTMPYKEIKDSYFALWNEYVDNKTPESRFVHLIDKLEMVIQAKYYLNNDKTVEKKDILHFYNSALEYSKQDVNDSVLYNYSQVESDNSLEQIKQILNWLNNELNKWNNIAKWMNNKNEMKSAYEINNNIDTTSSHPAYRNFITSLKTDKTRRIYAHCLRKNYLLLPENKGLSLDQILRKDPKLIESEIISIVDDMWNNRKLSYSTVNLAIAVITHFFEINDVTLNKRKIGRFKGENTAKYEYRSYTHDEIQSMLNIMDERDKAAVLLMASTGMRIGALDLKLKHLKRWEIDQQGTHVYQITVYPNSTRYKYKTFCTPECARAIDTYLELRKRYGDNLRQDPQTGNWLPIESPLFIKQFDKEDPHQVILNKSAFTRTLAPKAIHYIIIKKLEKLGIRTKMTMVEGKEHDRAKHKNELHPCHSLRIFAVTNMQRAKVDKTIREMIVGHSTGLDATYYKPQEEETLQEYLKAVDNLTINNEYRLKKQVQYYKQKADSLDLLKEQFAEMQEQFRLINNQKGLH